MNLRASPVGLRNLWKAPKLPTVLVPRTLMRRAKSEIEAYPIPFHRFYSILGYYLVNFH